MTLFLNEFNYDFFIGVTLKNAHQMFLTTVKLTICVQRPKKVQSNCAKYHKNCVQRRTSIKLCTMLVLRSKRDLNLRPKKLAPVCVLYRPGQVSRLK